MENEIQPMGDKQMATKPFVFRGSNTFHFARKRHKLDSLRSRMAEHRTCHPGGGGMWNGMTGDGEAWSKNGDIFGRWRLVRKIKAGQWCGPWARERVDDI